MTIHPDIRRSFAKLIRTYLDDQIDVRTAHRRFLQAYKGKGREAEDRELSRVLNNIFFEFNNYTPEAKPGYEDEDNISELTLRQHLAHYLGILESDRERPDS